MPKSMIDFLNQLKMRMLSAVSLSVLLTCRLCLKIFNRFMVFRKIKFIIPDNRKQGKEILKGDLIKAELKFNKFLAGSRAYANNYFVKIYLYVKQSELLKWIFQKLFQYFPRLRLVAQHRLAKALAQRGSPYRNSMVSRAAQYENKLDPKILGPKSMKVFEELTK